MARPFAILSKPMARAPARSIHLVLGNARHLFGMTQNEFGTGLGASRATQRRAPSLCSMAETRSSSASPASTSLAST
jgi:hypothetical protein